MAKMYVKKPIPVEAMQYTGKNIDEVQDFCQSVVVEDGWLKVHTLEGFMKAPHKRGDYVVKGTIGEFYICDKKIFEDTYEEVDGRQYVGSSSMF